MEETQSQNARLMSLLEKMAKPVENCTINLEVPGVFAFPEEWKAPDEANPTLFAYKIHFQGIDITEGKIAPRELTEQEKKEIEEAAMAKKKPPPKDNKKGQPEPPPLSPEELERQRILEEERLAAEKKAREEWEALTDEERFYRTYEDQFKKDSLKFANNKGAIEKDGEDLVVFEEKVALGGAWLYFTKFANATEEEMAKMRKSKPKNLNLMDLNPCLMRAWIDLSYFQTPGVSELVYRAKVERFYNPEDKPEELPNPNLEKTYILVKITLDPPITPLITDVQPRVEDMVPKPVPIPKLPLAVEVVNEFRQQLAVIMESLAMEYSGMFAKEMNQAQEPKAKLYFSAQQKRDIREQRKEKFLYDFNTSGKYNILKEKMKKSLMRIVRDKFQKSGSLTGVTADSKDQFYSELYIFLTEQMRQTLNDLIQEKKDELHEELVVSAKQANKERETAITSITKETDADRELRLATENEILNNLQESERAFKGLLTLDRENHKNAYMYCQYLLRRKNFARAEDILNEALRYNNENRVYITLLSCLLARRGRRKEAIICLNSLLDRDPSDSLSNTLMSFIYAKLSNEPKLGRKFLAISQRILMRKLGLLPPKVAPHSIDGETSPTASPKQSQQPVPEDHLAKKVVLTDEQNDEIWTEVVEYLVTNGIYDLAEQVVEEIHFKETPRVEYFRAQLAFIKGDFNASIEMLNRLIENDPRNCDYLLSKANYCFEKAKYSEAEETYIQAFKLKTTPKTFTNFLRLGYTFLYRKSWGDARAVLTKACELKPSSSLGWLGLGVACLRTEEYSEGEKALGQANIYDPVNADTWGYLALLCLYDGVRMEQAHQALREMLKCEVKNTTLVEEIADFLVNNGKFELAEILYKKILDTWQGNHLVLNDDVGNIHTKLAKLYAAQERLNDAKLYYSEALKYLQGETERERVELLLADVNKAAMETGFNNA